MPSRPLDPLSAGTPPSPPPRRHHHTKPIGLLLLPPILAASLAFASLILLSIVLYKKLSSRFKPPATPTVGPTHNLRRFSYSLLRRATSSFSPSTLIGRGGFGSVHKATLPSHSNPPSSAVAVAVKLMDPSRSPLQGQREFNNELFLAHHTVSSPHLLSLIGFSSNRRRDRLLLVYELMPNRSLQDSLLESLRPELSDWRTRFAIVHDVASGLDYLHHSCNPPVIHGDIKPSNVLLDADFRAKIGDFGLARLKTDEDPALERHNNNAGDENASILEETGSVIEGVYPSPSPESFVVRPLDVEVGSPEMETEKGSASEGCLDGMSIDKKATSSRRDWWWKQDNGGSAGVKDYVMDWIGTEIKKERPNSRWVDVGCKPKGAVPKIESRSKRKKRWEWWKSMDDDKEEKPAGRKPREWWKEEFCDELSRKSKNKNKRGHSSSPGKGNAGEEQFWWRNEDEAAEMDEPENEKKKRKSMKSNNSRSSIDWWLDGLNGELLRNNGKRNSLELANGNNSDFLKSNTAVSSTPSMRGTVCYVAPEYGGAGGPGSRLSEKCDVYSFGVLLLVLVSGRRPLQVTASPISEFERANLISWARQLACHGKLLDLIDKSIHSLDEDQAVLCITIALLCLQRSPGKRPSMREIVEMLSGHASPPQLPFEFSPSPPSNLQFKPRKKAVR